MASAPPMETSVPVGFAAAPPSYDEAMGAGGHYPQGTAAPPPVYKASAQEPYPPQAYTQMYPPPQPAAPVSGPVVSVQTVYVQPTVYGDVPTQTCCPVCSQPVVTRLEHHSGTMAWLICAGLCIIGCMYGCCLIPFCVDGLKDVTHFCPNCNNAIGYFKRL